jgi:hypothetical protein
MKYSRKHIVFLVNCAKEAGLSFPPESEGKTYAWLQRHYNGIGAEWMPRVARRLATWLFRKMEPAALYHDVEFLCKNKSYWKFTKANIRLFYNGIKLGCFFSAFFLAAVCQMFGWSAWIEGKESMAYYYFYCEGL